MRMLLNTLTRVNITDAQRKAAWVEINTVQNIISAEAHLITRTRNEQWWSELGNDRYPQDAKR